MNSYTVIYSTDKKNNDNIKTFLDKENNKIDSINTDTDTDNKNQDHYLFNGKRIQVKYDKIIVKDIYLSDIELCTKDFKANGITVMIKEYIGKKNIDDNEKNILEENIKHGDFYIHTNKDIYNNNNHVLMFTNPIKFGSAYGIITKNSLMIFSQHLDTIDNMFESVSTGCTNLSLYTGSMVLSL